MADKYNKTTRYLIDDLNLDVQRGELTRQEEVITLPKLSYDLLVALAKSAPALLSQEQLMAIVWPERVIGDETLKQRVKLLRKSLGDDASAPTYIEAVRGRGYRLIPAVKCECVVRSPPSVMLDLSANDRFPSIAGSQFGTMWRRMSLLGLVAFIGMLVSLTLSTSSPNNVTEENPTSNSVSTNEVSESVVKTNAERLYLRGRDYYHRYRKQDNDIAIDFFLKAINENYTFSPAYAALSQAYSQKYFQFSGQESDKQLAIDNAYQALSYDNQSADGYKALGTAYYVSGWLSKSIKTLHRGLAIEADEIEILINLAFIYSEQGELEKALHWHKVILEQTPEHALAMMHTGLTLQRAKQFDAAKFWYEKALTLQPDYLLTSYHLAQLAIDKKDYIEASNLINEVSQTNTNQQALLLQTRADIEYFQGKLTSAQQLYQQAATLKENDATSRANVLARLLTGTIAKKQENNIDKSLVASDEQTILLLKAKQQQGNEQAELSLLLAEIYSAKGQFTLAMRYLTQAIEQGYQLDYRVLDAPLFNGLREQAVFQRLTKQQKEAIPVDNFFLL
ncbi:winged helix-turn-helix domain-containing protein [Cognaticolwellia mytili]|uniref:winged helix-turn-helix domain-containing protein n=1 Tax=Cognaticolwellia mytili TaxID=1888913 RepID=UPI000A16D7E3|nr:winged helix-turn-helix domain-containing protein [Cognaticolwellia mytili]